MLLAITSRERNMLDQAVQNAWCEHESARAQATPTLVVVSYLTNEVQIETKIERNLIWKAAKFKYKDKSLVVFLQCVRYKPTERLAYTWKVSRCGSDGTLLYV